MEETERELFASGLRHVAESLRGPALDAALAELGWRDALKEDRTSAVSVLFECQGSANTTSAALERVLLEALGVDEDGGARALCLPPLGAVDAPGRVADGRCAVRGLALAGLAERAGAVVVVVAEGCHCALAVPRDALELRTIAGIDPDLALLEVRGDVELAAAGQLGVVPWEDAVATGQLALGHELVGAARTMVELARQHALDRVQFGRAISTFQAVRHRLADSFVAVEAAAALLDEAWQDPSAYAAMGKSFAGREAILVARHSQQVLAGIGFTTEHPFHRYVRRVLVLDQLLGSGSQLTRRLGAAVLGTGDLPPEFPL
jgi:Acyl-CoA dehydrogenase, C-terminal domain